MGSMGVMGRRFGGWRGRDDFEFDAVVARGSRSGGTLCPEQQLFPLEGNFLALEIERAKSLDGGEEFEKLGCTGLVADELKGFLVQELIDGGLNALGLR